MLALLAWNPYPLKVLELKTFDWLIMNTEPVQNENILLVDLNEELIEAYGGYPLPRTFFSSAIQKVEGVPSITVLMPDPRPKKSRQRHYFSNDYDEQTNSLGFSSNKSIR